MCSDELVRAFHVWRSIRYSFLATRAWWASGSRMRLWSSSVTLRFVNLVVFFWARLRELSPRPESQQICSSFSCWSWLLKRVLALSLYLKTIEVMGNCLAPLRDMFGRRMTWRSDEPQRRMPSTPNGRPQPSESRSDPAMSDVHIREDHETDWMMCHTLGPVHTTNNLTRKQVVIHFQTLSWSCRCW